MTGSDNTTLAVAYFVLGTVLQLICEIREGTVGETYLEGAVGVGFSNVSGTEPVLAVLVVEVLARLFGLLVVALHHVATANVDLAARVWPVADPVVALLPVDQFDIAAD